MKKIIILLLFVFLCIGVVTAASTNDTAITDNTVSDVNQLSSTPTVDKTIIKEANNIKEKTVTPNKIIKEKMETNKVSKGVPTKQISKEKVTPIKESTENSITNQNSISTIHNITNTNYATYFDVNTGKIQSSSVNDGDTIKITENMANKQFGITKKNIIFTSNDVTITNSKLYVDSDGNGSTIKNLKLNLNDENNAFAIDVTNANVVIKDNNITVNYLNNTAGGIRLIGANNSEIRNNLINITAEAKNISYVNNTTDFQGTPYTYGIGVFNSSRVNIDYNIINITNSVASSDNYSTIIGIASYGHVIDNRTTGDFEVYANNNNITFNTVMIQNDKYAYGIAVQYHSYNNTIKNNTIKTITGDGAYASGIQLSDKVSDNYIFGNDIDISAINYTYGIDIIGSPDYNVTANLIENNTILVFASKARGIELYFVKNSNISKTIINATGTYANGIGIGSSVDSFIYTNHIRTNGTTTEQYPDPDYDTIKFVTGGIYIVNGTSFLYPNQTFVSTSNNFFTNSIYTNGITTINLTGNHNSIMSNKITAEYNGVKHNGSDSLVTKGYDNNIRHNTAYDYFNILPSFSLNDNGNIKYKSLKKEDNPQKTYIITNENYNDFFTKNILNDNITEGSILKLSGLIIDKSFIFNKPVTITSNNNQTMLINCNIIFMKGSENSTLSNIIMNSTDFSEKLIYLDHISNINIKNNTLYQFNNHDKSYSIYGSSPSNISIENNIIYTYGLINTKFASIHFGGTCSNISIVSNYIFTKAIGKVHKEGYGDWLKGIEIEGISFVRQQIPSDNLRIINNTINTFGMSNAESIVVGFGVNIFNVSRNNITTFATLNSSGIELEQVSDGIIEYNTMNITSFNITRGFNGEWFKERHGELIQVAVIVSAEHVKHQANILVNYNNITTNSPDGIGMAFIPFINLTVTNNNVKASKLGILMNSTTIIKMNTFTPIESNSTIYNNSLVTLINTGSKSIRIILDAEDPDYAGINDIGMNYPSNEVNMVVDSIKGNVVVVNVTDVNKNPINVGNVTFSIDGTNISTVNVTDGQAKLYYVNSPDTYTLVAMYNENGFYDNSTVTFNVTIDKSTSSINAELPNMINLGDMVNVKGTLINQDGNGISNSRITFILNDMASNLTTATDGSYSYSFNATKGGLNNIIVSFDGNDNIYGITDHVMFNVMKYGTNLSVNYTDNVSVGDDIIINGMLTDENNNILGNVPLVVNYNGKTMNTTTDSMGKYMVNIPTNTIGIMYVESMYNGNNTHNSTKNIVEVMVDRHRTNLTLNSVDAARYGNIMSITGMLTDSMGNKVANKTISIRINNNEIYRIMTDSMGMYAYNYTVDVLDENNLTVVYKGDIDYYNVNVTKSFTIDKAKTNIILNYDTPIILGYNITIDAKVIDENNLPLANKTINVLFNSDESGIITDENGMCNFTIEASIINENTFTFTYEGSITHEEVSNKAIVNVIKRNTTILVEDIVPVELDSNIVIIFNLRDDSNNETVPGKTFMAQINSMNIPVIANANGSYSIFVTANKVGDNSLKINFEEDELYYSSMYNGQFNVLKHNSTIILNPINTVTIGNNITISGLLTGVEDTILSNMDIIIMVNNDKINTKTDNVGKFSIAYTTKVGGVNKLVVTFNGSDIYNVTSVSTTFNVSKIDTKIELNTINNTVYGNKTIISGMLKDMNNNPIRSARILIKVNNEPDIIKITNNDGMFTYEYMAKMTGRNDVKVMFNETTIYNSSMTDAKFNVEKQNVDIMIDSIVGTIGDKITLSARIYDKNGNPVNSGNIVFKINGKTLRTDGSFNSNMSPMKFSVVNGMVQYTLTADSYLCNAKNITVSYSGSMYYNEAKSDKADITLNKRTAQVTLTVTPTIAKQMDNMKFMVTLKDITPNSNATLIKDGRIVFKINSKTLKDENGNIIILNVTDNTLNYTYKLSPAMASTDKNNNLKDYMVEAIYTNKIYNSNSKANATFNVEKSDVSFNYGMVQYNTTSKKLSIKANLTDSMGNLVVGTNKICIKVNGKAIMDKNNQTKYFTMTNGQFDQSNIQLTNTMVNSITLVTGQRYAYNEVRNTTTKIVNKP